MYTRYISCVSPEENDIGQEQSDTRHRPKVAYRDDHMQLTLKHGDYDVVVWNCMSESSDYWPCLY